MMPVLVLPLQSTRQSLPHRGHTDYSVDPLTLLGNGLTVATGEAGGCCELTERMYGKRAVCIFLGLSSAFPSLLYP